MKYFVVTTRAKPGETTIYYPENYQEITSVTVGDKYFEENGQFKRLHVIPDELAVNIVRPDVVEVTETEANRIALIGEPEMTVNDEAKIRLIEIKTRLGQALTASELKAIDPDDSTSGIVKTKTLKDKIVELKAKEKAKEFKKEKYA